MDCSSFTPNSAFGTFSDTAMDLDLMDELLCDGCWVKIGDEFSVPQAEPPTSGVLNPSRYASLMGSNCGTSGTNSHQETDQKVEEKNFVDNPPQDNHRIGTLDGTDSQSQVAAGDATSLVQSRNFPLEGRGLDRGWWIGPTANPEPSSSVKERLKCAIEQLKGFTEDGDVLIQIWVPIKKGGKDVLSTMDQPFFIDGESKSLGSYRNVSKAYHFPTDGDPKQLVGLPGRVFLQKLPDWTPDVSFFRSEEYPRKSYAKQYNIRGSLAVPVFERGSWTCLGVVEVVTTAQKVNYRPELENVCKALEAVDLRSSQDCCPPSMKACKEFYQEAVPEISEILESVCKTHRLPLALAWAPCFREGKGGCRHFDKSYAHCISTLDSACFVADSDLLPFHVACSEQYLFLGQGIVGKAFTTNKQHFANDITAFSKTEYPFSHHAMMFGLHAALAIPLQGTSAGSADFVLEFFLPKDCQDTEKQKQMNYLLPLAVQQACRSLNVVINRDLDENIYRQEGHTLETVSSVSKKTSPEESPWVSRLMEAQKKGKSICASLEGPKEEPEEEFKVRTERDNTREEELYNKQQHTGPGQFQQSSGSKVSSEYRKDSSLAGDPSLGTRKAGEKRRTKTEKTIGLPVLRQYFAGSLKDAAKSLGVCPTTLKRICRQHGIARWPSRKIKKVGHSLKKLQLVIDSVQGAEGAIQIGSFYTTFPELNSPNPSVCDPFSTPKMTDNVKQSNPQAERGAGTSCGGASASKSPSSSCSHSSGSSTCCSAGAKQHATGQTFSIGDACTVEDPGSVLKRTHSDAELHALNREEPKVLARSQSHKTFADHPNLESLPPFPNSSGRNQDDESSLRVKATFGEDKVRFSLQPRWGFKDLQQELAKRFNIQGVCTVGIKYLDDDHEWVLLTCDDDLEECKDIYRLSHKRTIKIILNQASQEHPDSTFGGGVPLYMP